jgi:hypothetical protein
VVANATGTIALSPADIHLLLEGISVHRSTYHQHYHRPQPQEQKAETA